MRTAGLVFVAAFALSGCAESTFLHEVIAPLERPKRTEEFVIKEIVRSRADILWVIDNSGSMNSYQEAVIRNTETFIREFSKNTVGTDWKMGLLSTDTNDPPYIGFRPGDELTSTTINPVLLFQAAVGRLGTYGDGTEKVYDPVILALDRFPTFLRPGAKLFIIVVSDEEEQSRSYSTATFLSTLRSRLAAPDHLITYSVLGDDAAGCYTGFRYAGSRYEEFVTQSAGQRYLICSDFGTSLAQIAIDMGSHMEATKLDLQGRPILATLKVFYQDRELPGGPKAEGGFWIYDVRLNAVVFHDLQFAAGDLEKVRVEYELPKPNAPSS